MLPFITRLPRGSKNLFISTILVAISLTSCLPNPQYGYERIVNRGASICNSQDCVDDANEISSYMDTTVDPCTNFYDFVCGNFTRNAEFLPGLPLVDPLVKIGHEVKKKLVKTFESGIQAHDPDYVVKLKEYYNLCIDEETILKEGKTHLLYNLKYEGLIGWPVLEHNKVGTTPQLPDWSGTWYPQNRQGVHITKLHPDRKTEDEVEELPPQFRPPSFPEWRNLPRMVDWSAKTPDTEWKTAPINWTVFDPDDKWNLKSLRSTLFVPDWQSQFLISTKLAPDWQSQFPDYGPLPLPGRDPKPPSDPSIQVWPGSNWPTPDGGDLWPGSIPPPGSAQPDETRPNHGYDIELPAPSAGYPGFNVPFTPILGDIEFDWASNDVLFSKRGFFFNAFLEVKVIPDVQNPSRRTLVLLPPSFAIPADILTDPAKRQKQDEYFEFMKQVAKSLGVSDRGVGKLLDIHHFQMQLAKLTGTAEERQKGLGALLSVGELELYFPYVRWFVYLQKLLSPYYQISRSDRITVAGLEYFAKLKDLLDSKSKMAIADYAYWRAIEFTVSKWDPKLAELQRSMLLGKIENKESRPEFCTDVVSRSLPLATGALFVKNHFDKSTKEATAEIFSDLRNTFRGILQTAEWMDHTTRAEALRKLEKILPLIGYPREYESTEIINAYHNDLTINNASFLVTTFNVNIFSYGKSIKSLSQPVRKDDWTSEFGKSAVVNAFYYPPHNSIIFPASILQPPVFKVSNPKYMNYARLGYVVGHEMTHGFDTGGSQFNANGQLKNWWENRTHQVFVEKVKCIIDQYSSYIYKDLNLHLNGEIGQQENVADNGGLKMAYKAYKSWSERNLGREEKRLPGLEKYSNKQMFWISFANSQCARYQRDFIENQIKTDGHAPNPFRVIGTVSNIPEFGTDFKCEPGSPMNPHKKCTVW